jgi:uncharacterized membrane protein
VGRLGARLTAWHDVRMDRTVAPLTGDIAGLVALFVTSGATHLVKPEVFEPLVPRVLPRRREIVYASGLAELVCAAGLLHPRTRRYAGWASAGLLLAVFPGNVQMSVSHARRAKRRGTVAARATFAGTLARLPMQWPLVRAALRAAGRV